MDLGMRLSRFNIDPLGLLLVLALFNCKYKQFFFYCLEYIDCFEVEVLVVTSDPAKCLGTCHAQHQPLPTGSGVS
jgi:hypothetical protein